MYKTLADSGSTLAAGKRGNMTTSHLLCRFSIVALVAATVISMTAGPARADHGYPSDGDHPLRIIYYFVAPIGNLLERTVTRPLARVGREVAPYEHIDYRGFRGCSRERPARSCTDVVKGTGPLLGK